ncbi:MAG TPA: hypothetical protein VLE89_06895 [Chlamydiales bacterium]|nr:hypothetical protein [Chlamydiales bacterium]
MKDWYPDEPAIYDVNKTYLENAEMGPFFKGKIPKRPKIEKKIDFLGFKVNSPIGIPAGPLLNSKWIALAAKLGFDIVSYKTIRNYAHPAHALPNVIFVKQTGPHEAVRLDEPSEDLSQLTITNSFGNPSRSPEYLIADIAKANASLGEGQVMIVSIFGAPNQGISMVDDFVRTAVFAKEAGAKIIEANFSCPNVDKSEGCLYMSPETVFEYAKKISEAIRPIPLLIKVGVFSHPEQVKEVFFAAARGGVKGICGLNSVSMRVTNAKGEHPLGETRKTSGVTGGGIRSEALHFIRKAAEIIRKDKLDLLLIGCGGIMRPEHFTEFFNAGADIAMAATGMMWDPFLALRYHEMVNHAHAYP